MLLWSVVGQQVLRLSFTTWYRLRNVILRLFGAKIDASVRIRRTATFTHPWNLTVGRNSSIGDRCIIYSLGTIVIGDHVSVSQGSHLCAGTHDYRLPSMPLLRPPIVIENYVWIAADAFVGPNVTIREGAILAARGVAFRDLDAWSIYSGNPAVKIKTRPRMDAQ